MINPSQKACETIIEQVYTVRPPHVNGYGRLFGGQLMQWIDETAGIAARRYAKSTVTTAAIDNLNFKYPAFQNDMIVLVAKITYVGRTSMEVRVDTYIENLQGYRNNINRAYVIMVAIDGDGKPIEIPTLEISSEAEQAEWDAGKRRYELRRQRRVEGF